MKENNSTEVN